MEGRLRCLPPVQALEYAGIPPASSASRVTSYWLTSSISIRMEKFTVAGTMQNCSNLDAQPVMR